jgi:hypothetical protein
MAKVVSAQRPFTMLLGTLRQGSDPSLGPAGNPDISRTTMTMQYMPEVAVKDGPTAVSLNRSTPGTTTYRGNLLEPSGLGPQNATGSVQILLATGFQGPTSILLGQYTLTTDVDYTVDVASLANTTAALTAAIDALPQYSASDDGVDTVTITGPVGLMGNMIEFRAGGMSPGNFTLTPTDGSLRGAEPTIGPVTFTT